MLGSYVLHNHRLDRLISIYTVGTLEFKGETVRSLELWHPYFLFSLIGCTQNSLSVCCLQGILELPRGMIFDDQRKKWKIKHQKVSFKFFLILFTQNFNGSRAQWLEQTWEITHLGSYHLFLLGKLKNI